MTKNCVDCGIKLKDRRSKRCGSCAAEARWRDPTDRAHRIEAISKTVGEHWKAGTYVNNSKMLKAAIERGCYDSPETRNKFSGAAHKRWSKPGARKTHSELIRRMWKTGTYDDHGKAVTEAHARGCYDYAPASSPSKLELSIFAAVANYGLKCISQYRPDKCPYIYDIYLPAYETLIEVDGDYWHSLPGQAEKDSIKDEWAMENGYDIIRIPERAIVAYGIDKIIQTLINILEERYQGGISGLG